MFIHVCWMIYFQNILWDFHSKWKQNKIDKTSVIDCTEACILNGFFVYSQRKHTNEMASNIPALWTGKDVVCHYVSPLYHRQERPYVSDRIELKRSKIEDRPRSVCYTFSFLFVYLHPGDTMKSGDLKLNYFLRREYITLRVSCFSKRRNVTVVTAYNTWTNLCLTVMVLIDLEIENVVTHVNLVVKSEL